MNTPPSPSKRKPTLAARFLKLTTFAAVGFCVLQIVPFSSLAGLYDGRLKGVAFGRAAGSPPSLKAVAHTFGLMGHAVGSLPYDKLKPGNPIGAGARWAARQTSGDQITVGG